MAQALGATLGEESSEQSEVLSDVQKDMAYQDLKRARTTRERLDAMEQRAGYPGGGDLDSALAEPDTLDTGTARGRLAAGTQSANAAVQRAQQAKQMVQATQKVVATVKRARWIVTAAAWVWANLPLVIAGTLIAFAISAVGYCSQPANAGDCAAILGQVLLDNVRSVFGGDVETKTPSSSDAAAQVSGAAPGSQDASDTGTATPSQVDTTPVP